MNSLARTALSPWTPACEHHPVKCIASGPAFAPPLAIAAHSVTTLDTVHCMDALALLRALPAANVDMILTSPPYDNLRAYKGYAWDFEGIAAEMYRVLKTGGVAVWVVADATINASETLVSMRQALCFVDVVGFNMFDSMIYKKLQMTSPQRYEIRYSHEWEYMFVLSKGYPTTRNILKRSEKTGKTFSKVKRNKDGTMYRGTFSEGGGPLSNVWEFGTGRGHTGDSDCFEHPAPFPEELARRHILTWSNPGDTVLDFFAGSGTTLKIAALTGRRWIGCDIAPEYVDLCKRRLAKVQAQPLLIPFATPTPAVQAPLFDALAQP